MRSSPLATISCLVLLVCAGSSVGACGISVELGFEPDPLPPTCDFDGVTLASGEEAPSADGCNSCTCSKDGELVCTQIGCDPCPPDEIPLCAEMPAGEVGCYLEPMCGPGGWECVDNCPCATLIAPECPLPFDGCFYDGPYCDGQQWVYGPPLCPSCPKEILCEPPQDPLCYVEPICNDQLVWDCQVVCPPCADPPPQCGEFTVAMCEPEGWVCEGNAMCGPDVVDCPPSIYPGCSTYADCSQNGWVCQESCDPAYCPDEVPACDPGGLPNCSYFPVCSSQGWFCAESCM